MKNKPPQKNKWSKEFSRILYWTLLLLRSILFPLYKIPFVIIIILFGYYAFSINDQGQDMMAAFASTDIWHSNYLLFFELFLLFWAISIWNVSRVLLAAANLKRLVENEITDEDLAHEKIGQVIKDKNWVVASVDPNYRRIVSFMNEWIPRILAMCPYLIFIEAYTKQSKLLTTHHSINIIVIVIVAVLHLLYMVFRKWLSDKIFPNAAKKRKYNRKDAYSLEEEKGFIESLKKARIVTNTCLTVLMTIIMFIYSLAAAKDVPSAGGKPGLIVLAGFTVYIFLGFLLNLLVNRLRIPLFILLVIFALFYASKFNNNHTIQTLSSAPDKAKLVTRHNFSDSAYFDYWLNKKLDNHIFDSTKDETIFIVAAEGGGIRNCYWTYKVLNELQRVNPGFYNKTFAVTGVSGGSIGLGFYYNFLYYCDSLLRSGKDTVGFNKKIDSICSADYLSRVTYGFMFPDLLQRFIPARIDRWDRSKYLANSFDDGFSHRLLSTKAKLLSHNYLDMWADTTTAYKYPVMLFNTIFNEDGSNAIFSPYRLSDTYYAGAMDLLFESNRSVPMKEAMVSSARFPILTAPGLVWRDPLRAEKTDKDSIKLGHISDGGGFENTGIQTAEQTAMLILNRLKARKPSLRIKVKIIYIGTGTGSVEILNKIPGNLKTHGGAIGKSYELAWLNGGLNTIFGWIKSSYNISVRLNPDLSVLQFGLGIREKVGSHKLPLGWYLSEQSKNEMAKQTTYQNAGTQFKNSMDKFKKLN